MEKIIVHAKFHTGHRQLGYPGECRFVHGHTWRGTVAIATEAIDRVLQPRGVAIMLDAEHFCMSIRGVQKEGARTLTTRFTGRFKDDPAEQVRFLTLIGSGKA